ncbi:FAD dependent oxidoreductase superfamily [Talaromyces proteolyticus]|uniref:FAD dependent oxidoreductase superfamily n=1 Tax=Talaromyces proteolyticus TaxID=1131652 RepID=A0AAD4PS67_9EURO|nr:FAD dependent oxidoreductase superfamily [Talaromyces proteolyticus]KAH8690577.1 FAD dependent oxidoreductase superfamily [Talaromyces proteolyticus]
MSTQTPFLPVENPTLPFWLTDRSALDEHRSTPDLPDESDIVIIGGGYAGVSLAYHLLTSPSYGKTRPSITILEARTICSGATGRNGGHLRPDIYGLIPLNIQRHGLEGATELAEFELSHVKAIKDVIEKEQIDCDLIMTRNMNVYLDEDRGNRVRKVIEDLKARGCQFLDDISFLPERNIESTSGVKGAKVAFSYTSGTIWPYKFILGLLSKVLEYGCDKVNIQTNTPVDSVTNYEPDSHLVHTPRGTIKAKKVVYTTNAYTFGLLPEYERAIYPARGLAVHIDVPEGQTPPHLSYSYALRPHPQEGVDYFVVRPDGSIIVGGAHQTHKHPDPENNEQWFRNIDDSTLIESTKNYFDGYMQKYFRGWENSGAYVKEIWTGIMGYSFDSAPHVGEIPSRPGQYICAGFTGHGMPVIYLSSKGVADIILEGKKFEEVHVPRGFKATAERLEAAANDTLGGDIFRKF